MADKLLAKRLLEALPDEYELTKDDTRMIGALVKGNWVWSTTNGALANIVVADQAVRTAGDLRRVLATLPAPSPDEDGGKSAADIFADAIMKIVGPTMREVVELRVKLSSLIETLEDRGIELGADYTRRYFKNYERDSSALWSLLHVSTAEDDKIFAEHHADWIAQATELRCQRFGGADVDDELSAEWAAVTERLRLAWDQRAAEQDKVAAETHQPGE
jgi:hypothetical protein